MARNRSHAVWTYPQSLYWWDTIVPDFTPSKFVLTFNYICDQVGDLVCKRNTNYRVCVPLKKRVAIAIWKLATGDEYSYTFLE